MNLSRVAAIRRLLWPKPAHYLMVSVASAAGDILPLLGIGQRLQAADHRVTLVAAAGFGDLAERCRLELVALADNTAYRNSLEDKFLLSGRYHSAFASRHAVSANAAVYKTVRSLLSPELVILAVDRPLLWSDLLCRTTLRVPVIRLQIDLPIIPEIVNNLPQLPFGRVQERLAATCERHWQAVARDCGLRAGPYQVKRLGRSVRRGVPTVGLWPRWVLGGQEPPANIRTFGFMPTPELSNSGDIPFREFEGRLLVFIVGTLGTTRSWSDRYIQVSIEVCRRLAVRGVALGGEQPAGLGQFPEWFTWRKALPLPTVLSRANAVVHHGGIGTAAAALEAGVPQLIVPRVFMQPINAEWLQRLGVAEVVRPEAYTPGEVSDKLRDICGNVRQRRRCTEMSTRVNRRADVHRFCSFVEAWRRTTTT
jgi:rhamnosyltransferase subunit B